MNRIRSDRGLRPLLVDSRLVRASRRHSTALLRANILTHRRFGARMAAAGVRGPLYGENLAWGVGTSGTARFIVRAWLNSPGHRANLLRPGFRRIGVGARVGEFAGYSGATVVTAQFAGS